MSAGSSIAAAPRSVPRAAFRERDGRLAAARNLQALGIDRLVVIGGDGSLTGADLFRREWGSLLDELVESGQVTSELAARHPQLGGGGLVGSIDNDFWGTDMTIGADTALNTIVDALDKIKQSAVSTRLAARCIAFLDRQLGGGSSEGAFIGYRNGRVELHGLVELADMLDQQQRPKEQWWLPLRPIERLLARGSRLIMVTETKKRKDAKSFIKWVARCS